MLQNQRLVKSLYNKIVVSSIILEKNYDKKRKKYVSYGKLGNNEKMRPILYNCSVLCYT